MQDLENVGDNENDHLGPLIDECEKEQRDEQDEDHPDHNRDAVSTPERPAARTESGKSVFEKSVFKAFLLIFCLNLNQNS